MLSYKHTYIYIFKHLFLGCLIFLGCFSLAPVSAQVIDECDASVLGPGFAKTLIDSIVPDDQRRFYTRNNLEKAWKSFDSFCCKAGLLGENDCAKKDLYNDDQLIVGSPYLIEHLLRVVRTYVQGNKEECDRYGLDCRTFLDKKAGYPGKPVCRRNGTEENVGDPLCARYDIEKGVDQLLSSTDAVMPGEVVGTFKKFRITGNESQIPAIPKINERDPTIYTISHMLRRTCSEVVAIVNYWNLNNERQLGVTYLPDNNLNAGLSELELCNIHMQELFDENAQYAIIASKQRAVHALDNDRFVLMSRLQDLKNDMLETLNKYGNALQEVLGLIGEDPTVECSA